MKIVKFKNLSKHKNIIQAISTKNFGSMKNEDNIINGERLSNFLKFLDITLEGVTMGQMHGSNIAVINDKNISSIENTDGLITNKKNIPLCVVIADCLPILFFDPK